MSTRKIVLFLVEGISDQTSLALIISKIVKTEIVRFHTINGDITSYKYTTAENSVNKINAQVKKFLNNNFLKKSDILKIVHLIDTDGAFISDEYMLEEDIKGFIYTTEYIKAKNIETIQSRNNKKSSIVNRLSTCTDILCIPYVMYYFSCNLEHVLHNEINTNSNNKTELAESFSDIYYKKEETFIEFINNIQFAVPGDYKETWDFIKINNNSLKRYSNFHLFFKSS
ncbi:hypothetical protein GC105_07645 [Alkalibaculum sp. M08DMB]|uniref:DUF4276 family protein n=1 Tax=Alkalibaculum sporogenes TaxID=2655001 RepID=A0A6A7K8L7_9FIRM|nr:hypothetical protein [Alkalibaculum sporogenes]MPW25661.1 hypothetical protein [Alkalibaculum sporogenes]